MPRCQSRRRARQFQPTTDMAVRRTTELAAIRTMVHIQGTVKTDGRKIRVAIGHGLQTDLYQAYNRNEHDPGTTASRRANRVEFFVAKIRMQSKGQKQGMRPRRDQGSFSRVAVDRKWPGWPAKSFSKGTRCMTPWREEYGFPSGKTSEAWVAPEDCWA